jgi:uncharacterized protein YraI
MKSIGLILSCAMLVCSAMAAAAKPAYVLSTVNLRAAPGTTNEVLAKIPGGSLVDAADCTGGWCAVTWQEKRGFAIETSLDLSGRVPARRAGPPSSGSGYVVERGPPVYYEGGEPPPPAYYYYGYGPSYYRPYGRSYYYGRYRHW